MASSVFDLGTWIVRPAIAILAPCFFRKLSVTMFYGHGSSHSNQAGEAGRYMMMTMLGFAALIGAYSFPMNRNLYWGLGFAGGFTLLDSHIEYYGYMSDGQRTVLLGFILSGLVGLAIKFAPAAV